MAEQIIDTPEGIAHYRRFALLQALRLEIAGMHRRGRSAWVIIKKEFNLEGNRKSVYEQFKEYVRPENMVGPKA